MLSVLIPTFNYSAYDLVCEIHRQCNETNIAFEILVSEDGGDQFIESNRKINDLSFSTYIENKTNIGRARNKNLLLNQSLFDMKLLLDSDVFPTSKTYIKNYLEITKEHRSFACFGGLTYDYDSSMENNLRYNYGIKRECKKASERSQNPDKLFLTSNTLLKNCDQKFDEKIAHYGFEEIVFSEHLKMKNIPIIHIDNAVIHKNVETNEEFMDKTKEGLRTLIFLEKSKILNRGKTKVSHLYHFLSSLYLSKVLTWLFGISEKSILNKLVKNGKPIWLFDAYRLLYFNKHY